MIRYRLRVPFNPVLENLLVFCDCCYCSIDPGGEIWADFTPLQKQAFDQAASMNYHQQISMQRVII